MDFLLDFVLLLFDLLLLLLLLFIDLLSLLFELLLLLLLLFDFLLLILFIDLLSLLDLLILLKPLDFFDDDDEDILEPLFSMDPFVLLFLKDSVLLDPWLCILLDLDRLLSFNGSGTFPVLVLLSCSYRGRCSLSLIMKYNGSDRGPSRRV